MVGGLVWVVCLRRKRASMVDVGGVSDLLAWMAG